MKVNVIRGADQIGGSIIEVSSDKTKLILDCGVELDETDLVTVPRVIGLFQGIPSYDAILISHYHMDHTGLLNMVLEGIPIYMAEKMFNIHKISSERMHQPLLYQPRIFAKDGEKMDGSTSFLVGDIKVTPFLCDHSAFDSYMFLLECEGDSVLYTGDFRGNGRKNFGALLRRLPQKVNQLIVEGTTLSRDSKGRNKTESEIEQELCNIMQGNKPVFMIAATTNIDRLVSVYRACVRTNRIMAMDAHLANVLTVTGSHVPNPNTDKNKLMRVIQVGGGEQEHKELEVYSGYKVSRNALCQAKFTICIRTSESMRKYIEKMPDDILDGAVLVYSMWNGYLNQERTKDFIDFCLKKGMRLQQIHTSGHADKETIEKLIARVQPDVIIAVHTLMPEKLKQMKDGLVSANQQTEKTGDNSRSDINYLWMQGDKNSWDDALEHYYELIPDKNMPLEKEIAAICPDQVKSMTAEEFYYFLHDKYFVWKYTQKNRLATTRKHLEKYMTEDRLHELEMIKEELFSANLENAKECLSIASKIRGLGPAGASGLLAILYPYYFGTVDQFVVKALLKVDELQEREIIKRMKPESLTISDAGTLVEIMRKQARQLNTYFHADDWTPRKVDMVLWAADR